MKPLATLLLLIRRLSRRVRMYLYRPLFASYGRDFRFDPDGAYSFEHIHVGDQVNLGYRPIMMESHAKILIGNKVFFGPEVVLIGGNHNTRAVGSAMLDVHEKAPNDDLGVTIEDDVWVGARAMILRGVTLGRGTIVGAASVVTRSTPPYAVVAGNPGQLLRFRWDVDTILEHERRLYPEELRLSKDFLERCHRDAVLLPPERKP